MTKLSAAACQRFLSRIFPEPNSGCWLWAGGQFNRNGYGVMVDRGERWRVHRLSWEMHVGPIPNGFYVLHKCDVRCCVNPQHLFVGTQSDNMRDMIKKGRAPFQKYPDLFKLMSVPNARRGEQHPRARLTAEDVKKIRQLGLSGMLKKDIADVFRIRPQTVGQIISGKRWKHLLAGAP